MRTFQKVCRSFAFRIFELFHGGRQAPVVRRDQIYTLFRLFTHPIDAFNDIKYENKASLFLANIMAFFFFIEQLISEVATGYLFGVPEAGQRSVLVILGATIGILLLWCICNWAACTLFDGEGRFVEIWIMTAYSLLPWLIFSPVITILSNVSSQDEAVLLSAIRLIGIIWTLLLVFLGMTVCQQFTVSKTAALCIVSIAGIVALLFLVLLFFSISQQMIGFVKNIILELSM